MLQHRLARRNSLRSLRSLRSDRAPREWSTKRAARAAGAAALLGCAQARRPRAARAFADIVAACAGNGPGACGVPMRGDALLHASVGSVVAANTALVRAASTASAFGPNTTRGARAAVGGRPGPGGCGAVCGAEQRSLGVGARSALRTS